MAQYIQSIKHTSQKHPLKAAMIGLFLTVFILMGLFFIFGLKIFPFGNGTIMTVDLGQQYIDFYQYYRSIFQGNWDQIFYSFQKATGGEMVGTWSYYLMSPYLILLLLFPQSWLTFAVALIVLLKLATAASAFQFMLGRFYNEVTWQSLTFSFAYAFIGYLSANQLNVMWLDGVIFLPFLIWGLEKIMRGQSGWTYVAWLALTLISNYYIGYMICLFLVLFFFYRAVANGRQELHDPDQMTILNQPLSPSGYYQTNYFTNLKTYLMKTFGKFAGWSIAGGGLAAFILMPTIFALSTSKGQQSSPELELTTDYPLYDIVSKFILGPFNFEQMPEGLPNIFIGSLALIMAILYFFNKKVPWQERLAAGSLVAVLLLSMNISGLNLIWHGLQYPIWYPYRFSFVFSFFLLFIGYQLYRQKPILSLKSAIWMLIPCALACGYLLYNIEEFDYLSVTTVIVSFVLFVGVTALLMMATDFDRLIYILLLMITISEVFANSVITVSSISYLKQDDFADYIAEIKPEIAEYAPGENEFYRMTKTFQRTKNDAMQLGYYDLNHFNSTMERNTTQLFKQLGQPMSDGFTNYTTGSLLTDALFGVQYYFDVTPFEDSQGSLKDRVMSTRADLSTYPVTEVTDQLIIHKNPHALSLAYMVNQDIQSVAIEDVNPVYLQDELLNVLTGNGTTNGVDLSQFEIANFASVDLFHIDSQDTSVVNTTYKRDDTGEDAFIDIHINFKTDQAYYITVPSFLNDEEVKYYLNGEPLDYDASYQSIQLFNIANNEQGAEKVFTIQLLDKETTLADVNLYTLDQEKVQTMADDLKENQLVLTDFSNAAFSGTVTVDDPSEYLLVTIPYAKGWHAKVNGQSVETTPLLNGSFMGIQFPEAGEYEVSFYYIPQGLTLGLMITITTSLVLVGIYAFEKKKNKNS
ncbi:YfhO family protein [Aerococcus urinaeequi]